MILLDDLNVGNTMFRCIDSGKLCDIWACCIERCHFKTLRQLLHDPRKFVSISEVQGVLVAYVAFGDEDVKLRVESLPQSAMGSSDILTEGNGVKERRWDNPGQRIESIIRQQRLETAWLQTAG
ncbi:protein STICHEL [Trifolium repens]|nr:protein STICHEL [Trifolium repens]